MANQFVNCDWGTTRFRLRWISLDDSLATTTILGEAQSDDGVAALAARCEPSCRAEQFRAILAQGLRQLGEKPGHSMGPVPVVISGMASSSIGWQELPYAQVPWRVDGSDLVWRELDPVASPAARHRTILVSGARTASDILRGEETEIVGLFQERLDPQLADRATVILPGTHSKHVRVEGRQVTDFRTFMTGELMDVIGRHSTLRHSLGDQQSAADNLSGNGLSGSERAAFLLGLELARDLPLSAALFRVRTRQVLDGSTPEDNRALLSGILIGSDVSYLANEDPDGPIVLCATAPLNQYYAAALDFLGLSRRLTIVAAADVERLSALGQACLARRLALI